jgi:hypothetical protein
MNHPLEKIEDLRERFDQDLSHYRNVMEYMGANVPIAVLCLPKSIENALIRDGCIRVYDLINRDLAEIKGIGVTRAELIASRLDEFFTVSI